MRLSRIISIFLLHCHDFYDIMRKSEDDAVSFIKDITASLQAQNQKKGHPMNQHPNNNRPPRQDSYPQNTRPPKRKPKKKIRFTPNKEGMIALVVLLLLAALIISLLILAIKGIVGLFSSAEGTTSSETSTTETTEAPVAAKWYDDYIKKPVSSGDVSVGELILVNFENKYELTDSISSKMGGLYGDEAYGRYFVLKNADIQIRRDILIRLRTMIKDLVDASPTLGTTSEHDRVVIVSGYRTIAYQKNLYENQGPGNYVAEPGHSEHHSGYAVDLKVFTSGKKTIEFREEEQAWMEANCSDYGFIVRYDGAKAELTGIPDETWHFRYVGEPHAQYMTENGLCMEEYLSLLRTKFNIETCEAPLSYVVESEEGNTEYEIYYVPASSDAMTDIPVPKATDTSHISISGDNIGGFIVTITK